MQTTINFGLKKPDPNDAYNKQNDNDNMDIIDAQLKANADAAAAAQTTADAAETPAGAQAKADAAQAASQNKIAVYKSDGTNQEDPDTTEHSLILTNHPSTPDGGTRYWYIQTYFYSNTTGDKAQIAHAYNGSPDVYIRHRYNNVWTAWQKVWHAGNDGAGSGLDADLLDGIHSTGFTQAKNGGKNIWVQSTQPTALATGDIWIQT